MSIEYRGERFSGYNKPKRTPNKSKKFAVLAKQGSQVKLVRFGDPNMSIKKNDPKRRKSFRARLAVLAKQGSQVKLVRFGDPNMSIKKNDPKRRKSFRARHRCDSSPPSKLSARYWSCKKW